MSFGPWLFGPVADLWVFLGSAALALLLVAARGALGVEDALPGWGFVVFVLAIDVAHVYATAFRTYFDRDELRRHRLRYFLTPACAWVAGMAVYGIVGAAGFWRLLAYLALYHFVRQQVGWAALYRARAGQTSPLDAAIDACALYAATLYPVLVWHARLSETRFAWFVDGDFADVSKWAAACVPAARWLWILALAAFAVRQIAVLRETSVLHAGRVVVVTTTAALWYTGIVATNSDFDFTVTNVIAHGVPYMALLWTYARAHRTREPGSFGSRIAAGGFGAFAAVLLLCAFAEETAWDRLVWGDNVWLFGDAEPVSEALRVVLVPLLAVPQATHYVLDGLLWRRRDTAENPSQRAALDASGSLVRV